jgi:hypothetical protein
LKGSLVSRFRHYQNLHRTEPRLRRLVADFRFTSISSLLALDPVPDAREALLGTTVLS